MNSQRAAKKQPFGRAPGRGGCPSIPSSTCARVGEGIARSSPRVYGWPGARNARRGRAELDQPTGVHDPDRVGDVGDDREVVADVYGADAIDPTEAADRIEYVALGRDVQPGGRLIEDDQFRPAGERHREHHSLLLSAGQLMGIGIKRRRHSVEPDLGEQLTDPRRSPRRGPVRGGGRRRSRAAGYRPSARGSARSSGPARRTQPTPLAGGAARTRLRPMTSRPSSMHAAPVDRQPAARVSHQRQGDGRLARARLADQTEYLAGADRERDVVDYVGLRSGDHHAQPIDGQQLIAARDLRR